MRNRKVEIILGILGGLILPFIVIVILYKYKFDHYTFNEYIVSLIKLKIAGRFLQFAAISNLALFFILLKFNKLYAARGVIGSTFVLVVIVFLLMI